MNDYRAYVECDYNSIYHHGIKGMKWGVRRFQNEDGSLTPEGQKRYGKLVDLNRRKKYADNKGDEYTRLASDYVYNKINWDSMKTRDDIRKFTRNLYDTDKYFKKLMDTSVHYTKEAERLGGELTKEYLKVNGDIPLNKLMLDYMDYEWSLPGGRERYGIKKAISRT